MIEGNAVLTSQSGTPQILDESGQNRSVKPRISLLPTGLQWATGKDTQAFLALSNGAAIGIGESTRLRFLNYQQRPFASEKEGFSYEPSTSTLSLELESGELALVAQRISPISELRVSLPQGSLRVHRGIAHIRYDQTGLHIAMIEGNLTYDYPGETAREFVSGGSIIRISDRSAQRREVASRGLIDVLPADAVQLHQAATHASRRVLFQANAETATPPEPVMVVNTEYFNQPSPRPYEFKE